MNYDMALIRTVEDGRLVFPYTDKGDKWLQEIGDESGLTNMEAIATAGSEEDIAKILAYGAIDGLGVLIGYEFSPPSEVEAVEAREDDTTGGDEPDAYDQHFAYVDAVVAAATDAKLESNLRVWNARRREAWQEMNKARIWHEHMLYAVQAHEAEIRRRKEAAA